MQLETCAFCLSDENGFVDSADFAAMAINFAIESEMRDDGCFSLDEMEAEFDRIDLRNEETDAAYDLYLDEMAQRDIMMSMQEKGIPQ